MKIGIVGCGHWGMNHIRIFHSFRRIKSIVCCDKNPERLNMVRRRFPGLITTTNYEDLIHDSEMDAIVVSTPAATHYEYTKKAILGRKHVLCEKPLSVRQEESKELSYLAKKMKKTVMVGYVFLYNNGIVELMKRIKKGQLGKILYLYFTRTNLGPIRDDVDVIYDLASHDIAIASFILGKWPEGVSANVGIFLQRCIPDVAFITLYYPGNIIVNIHVSWLYPKKIRNLVCVGDKKIATWDDLDSSEPLKIIDKGIVREPFYYDYGEFQLLSREGRKVGPKIKLSEPLKRQNAYFLYCVENKITPLTDVAFGHKITKILEAAKLSAQTKSSIKSIEWLRLR